MSLVCALSGVAPEDPVFSPSGYIFERRLIEKHLKTSEICPISGDELKVGDLQSVHSSKIAKPRPVTATSIPGMLALFQNEWDSTMTETFTLRQHVEQVRNQLAHSLYQHDAACRVIARLVRERDSARSHASQLQEQLAAAEAAVASRGGVDVEPGLSEDYVSEMTKLAQKLLMMRKSRKAHPPYDHSNLANMKCTGNYPLHQTTLPGITCCSVDPKNNGSMFATGGIDGVVVLFDEVQRKTRTKLTGHMRRVNRVRHHPTMPAVISASEDKTLRIWTLVDEDSYQHRCAHVIRRHAGNVHDISIHPLGSIFASCSQDGSWALHEVDSGRTLRTERNLATDKYRCAQFHPDGLLLGGGGEDGTIYIWEMNAPKLMASLTDHSGPITSMSFSENGYHLATSSEDGTVKLWDLRKSFVFETLDATTGDGSSPIRSVTFDHSGNFIATASNAVSLYYVATRTSVAHASTLSAHEAAVTDVCFAPDARYLLSTSMDRHVRLWEPGLLQD